MKQLHEFEEEISSLYTEIRKCESPEAARRYINQLIKLNEILGKMIFIEKIKVSDKLWQFFKDFDVAYESDMNKFFFSKIKDGEYIF